MNSNLQYRWIKTGAYCGLLASLIYPVMITINVPLFAGLILVGLFGFFLAVASIGLYHLLALNRKTVTVLIAAVFNIIASAIFNMMVIVQLAVKQTMRDYLSDTGDEPTRDMLNWIWRSVDKVHLGLDISWDFYLCAGSLLFAINMLRHPRFGMVFGGAGIVISVFLLGLNLYSFPIPPGQSGLLDLGPVLGLWYLVVAIQTFRSLRWVKEKLGIKVGDTIFNSNP
ncbi:MAG: hypothetical protein GF315_03720 [candidate division Zixibacteria bacterium]|nr:hypothetical protein [candidate division Zixibacteria bacterium]